MWCVPYTPGSDASSVDEIPGRRCRLVGRTRRARPAALDRAPRPPARPRRHLSARGVDEASRPASAAAAARALTSPGSRVRAPGARSGCRRAPRRLRAWARARSAPDAAPVSTPSSRASCSVNGRCSPAKRRLHSTTFRPNPAARRIISWPMLPTPSRPSVLPKRPCAFEYSFLFHFPARSSATLSGIRRSSARISAKASSATAIAFLPGQFET